MARNRFRWLLWVLLLVLGLMPATVTFAQQSNPHVIVETSQGKITLELFADKAPITVKNFLAYADAGFYKGTIFHRVIPDFMIQGGGLDAGLNEKKGRAPIKNESANGLANLPGTIAVARTSVPDSGTSQFFINLKQNSFLDKAQAADKVGYAVFGKIVEGMEVVEKIGRVATRQRGGHADVPLQDVVILSVRRRASGLSVALAGSFEPAKECTIMAYVEYSGPGQYLTLELPPGLEATEGKAMQPVPSTEGGPSMVLWKARGQREGAFQVTVRSSEGTVQSKTIRVATRASAPAAHPH